MILDTSFIIDLMEMDEGALDKHGQLVEKNETSRISSAALFELWSGVGHSKKGEEEKLKIMRALSGISTIALTAPMAEKAGEIHGTLAKEGRGIDNIDAMIASTALHENETLLTRNVKHFARVNGLRIESY
ncbi:MAG TPA: PIN domain-containing protein [Candidatus Nanoarchaeia archaeon]|nr:PIN domain-containing protein [Candidatus Nanoarchaeia archaeon]